jgi:hypothetical protein
MRIARELHDVVSHTIGVISVQAGVAAHLLHRRPDKAADSLAAIRQASDEALGELHAMLGVLREADGDGGRAPLTPAPGRPRWRARRPGGRGRGRGHGVAGGEPRRLPSAVDLAPTGWCRALTTWSAPPGPAGPRSPSPTTTAGWWSRSPTTATPGSPMGRATATAPAAARGSWGCGSGPGPSAAAWRPAPAPAAASASRPPSRWPPVIPVIRVVLADDRGLVGRVPGAAGRP